MQDVCLKMVEHKERIPEPAESWDMDVSTVHL